MVSDLRLVPVELLLEDDDLVQRTKNLAVFVTDRVTAASRLGVSLAFIDAVLGPRPPAASGVKNGVSAEAERLARLRTAPRSPTPLEVERKRLEKARGERKRARERLLKRGRNSGIWVPNLGQQE
jgi:hypothetical protein